MVRGHGMIRGEVAFVEAHLEGEIVVTRVSPTVAFPRHDDCLGLEASVSCLTRLANPHRLPTVSQ